MMGPDCGTAVLDGVPRSRQARDDRDRPAQYFAQLHRPVTQIGGQIDRLARRCSRLSEDRVDLIHRKHGRSGDRQEPGNLPGDLLRLLQARGKTPRLQGARRPVVRRQQPALRRVGDIFIR